MRESVALPVLVSIIVATGFWAPGAAGASTTRTPRAADSVAALRSAPGVDVVTPSSDGPRLATERRLGTGPAATAVSGTFTFTFNSPTFPWSPSDQALLNAWTAPGSPELAAVQQVAGRPPRNVTINIARNPDTGFAGTYSPGQMTIDTLTLDVFVHELDHAVHDNWILSNSTWEEGMARAAEDEELRLLAAQGITTPSGGDPDHDYTYDRYYDMMNVSDLGAQNGSLRGNGEEALALLRYEEGGYAFGKALIEQPQFLVQFNAQLFAQPSGNLSDAALVSMAAGVVPTIEGTAFATWYDQQGVLGTNPPGGCRMFQRINQWVADFFCRQAGGLEVPQSGATVTYQVYNAANTLIFSGQDVTSPLGWTRFSPVLNGYSGRVKVVASGTSATGSATSTFYRQAGAEDGVFGVVTNSTTGTVTFSSPTASFPPETVPVVDGAFAAPDLTTFRGTMTLAFSGPGLTARRQITKAASPYAVLLTGTTAGSTTTLQESATAIAYNGWKGMTDPVANGGAFRYSTTTGSTATFTFTGTTLTWLTRKGPGQGIAGVTIDGTNKGKVDLYATTVIAFTKAYTGLSPGSHTLTVKVTGTKNTSATGFSVAIDGFTAGTTTTQESAGTVGYNTWLGFSSANASSGQYRASGNATSTATFNFTGTGVDWVTTVGKGWGKAQVLIDGLNKGTVDLYSPAAHWQTVKTYADLAAGTHTITIKVLGTKNGAATSTKVAIDALVVHN